VSPGPSSSSFSRRIGIDSLIFSQLFSPCSLLVTRYRREVRSPHVDSTHPFPSRYTAEMGPYVSSTTRSKHDALKSSHRSSAHMESTYKMNPPRYSISSLKRGMLTPKQLLENELSEQQSNQEEALGHHNLTKMVWSSPHPSRTTD
jgi:hypothetical protein